MRSRFLTLLWLHVRRTWGFILFGFAAPLLLDVLFWAVWHWGNQYAPLEVESPSILSFFAVLMATILVATLGAEDRGLLSLPRYLMPFPVSNALLSNAYFVYAVLVSAGLAYWRAVCHDLLLGPHETTSLGVTMAAWQVALLLLALCTLAQVINAVLSGSGRASASSLGLVVVLPVCVLAGIFLVLTDRRTAFMDPRTHPELWIAFAPVSYLVTCILTFSHRRGTGGAVSRVTEGLVSGSARTKAIRFASQHAALTWYERKRFGRYFPLICGFALLVPVLAAVLSTKWLHVVVVVDVFSVIGTAIFLSAYMTIQRYRDHTSGFAQFVFTKPCPTTTIASARAHMLIRSIVLTMLITTSLVGIGFLAQGFISDIEPELLLSGGMFLFGVWLALSFAMPLFYVYLAAVLFVAPLAALGVQGETLAAIVLPIYSLGLLGVFVMGWKRYRPTPRTVLLMALAAIVTFAGAFLIAVDNNNNTITSLGLALAVCPWPLVPIVVAPFTIDWYRHR